MVLPGDHFDFVFTFQSSNAGVFRESWQLHTTPAANDGMRIRIALRGAATEADEGAPARARLEARLEAQAIQHAVEDILYDVIASVKTPRPPPTEDEQREMNRKLFEASNRGLHFTPAVFGDLCDLYARVVAAGGGDASEAPQWDGATASIASAISSLGVTDADEKAAEAEAAAAAEAAEEAGGKKGAKKKPKAKGKGKGKAADEPEPLEIKPLTAEQRAEARRGAFRAELGRLCAAATAEAAEGRGLYAVAREVLCELAEAVPELAGAARLALELPLRPHLDAEPPADQRASIEAALAAKARRARRAAAGSDVSSGEESEADSEEEEDEEDSEEAKAAAAAFEALPPEDKYRHKLSLQVFGRVGEAATLFAGLAAAATDETTSAVRSAVGMTLSAKRAADGVALADKVVVLRADLNAPTALAAPAPAGGGDGADAARVPTPAGLRKVQRAARAIQQLRAAGAASVVVLAHMGRPGLSAVAPPPGAAAPADASAPLSFEDPAQLSLAPYAPALARALGCAVEWVPACTPSAVQAALAATTAGGAGRVLLVENVRLVPEEVSDEAVYGLSGRREHLAHGCGVPMLDGTDVGAWAPHQVAVWLHLQCPGVAAASAWATYRDAWCERGLTGAQLLAADAAALALTGVADGHAGVLLQGIDKLRARASAEADARALDEAWAAAGGSGGGAGAGAGAGAGDDNANDGPTPKERAQRRAVQRVTAFRAALSRMGHVFVNDALEVCHTNNSSVVGVRPRAAAIVARQEGSPNGLRLAGANLASELKHWSRVLEPGKAAAPVVVVLGGADLARRARVFEHMVTVADTIVVGGTLGVAWARFIGGAATGATPLPAHAEATVRRLAGLAARRGVQVLPPVDFVTGDQSPEAALKAAVVAQEVRHRRVLAGDANPDAEPEDDDDEDDDDDYDDDDDSDEEAVAQRRQARADARAAAAAAKQAAAQQLAREAEVRAQADPSDTGALEAAVEVEYDGETAEVVVAEGGVPEADRVLDVGSDTREVIAEAVAQAATVVWTGPMGVVELADCQAGTRELVDALNDATGNGTTTLVGAYTLCRCCCCCCCVFAAWWWCPGLTGGCFWLLWLFTSQLVAPPWRGSRSSVTAL